MYVRFLVLASFYLDWCTVAFDEVQGDLPAVWLNPAGVSPFLLGQLVGDELLLKDPDDELGEALQLLMAKERDAVVGALLKGFGGVDGLFVALWKSGQPLTFDELDDADEDGQPERAESEADILGDPTSEKLAAYQWLMQGCEFLGPERSRAEYDGGW